MLIRTKPVKLHIGMGLSCGAEGFSERIQGNYGLLGAHFASKDLLFLMTEPPETAEPQAGMTVLVDQSGRQDNWNIAMDVVNNVVNRILLDGSARFTYQDQVYITTVLNRLGVTDTERFMTQVRQLRTESESTAHLLALYKTELTRLRERQETELPAPGLPVMLEEGEAPAVPAPDVEMSLTVLRRLDAVENFQRLYDLRRSWFHPANYFQRNELNLSEQLRFGGSVSLEETKRQLFQNARLSLIHHLNRYEIEEGAEAGGEAALSQAAAAALSGAVDNVLIQILNRPELRQDQWLRLEQALWQSGSNSLARFTLYHEAPPPAVPASLSWTEENAWNRYAGELREYQTLRQYLYPRTVETAITPPPPGEAPLTFLPVSGEEPEDLPAGTRTHSETETVRRELLREADSLETVRERLERVLKTEGRLPSPDRTPGGAPVLWHVERRSTAEEFRERLLETDRRQTELRRLERTLREQKIWPPVPSVRERFLRLEREALRQESRRTETLRTEEWFYKPAPVWKRTDWTPPRLERREPGRVPPLTLTAREAEEAAPALLEETLRQESRRTETLRTQERFYEPAPVREQTDRTPGEAPALRHVERTETAEEFRESVLETDRLQTELRRLERTLREQKLWPPEPSVRERFLRLEREALRQESRRTEALRTQERFYEPAPVGEQTAVTPPRPEGREPGRVPPLTLTAREAEEADPALLEEAIRQIDRHNRTVLQSIPPEVRETAPAPLPLPDLRRTLKDSLRALSEPETLLREMAETRQAEEAAPLTLTHREEMLLRQLPAEERKVYEAILSYGKDPEGTLAQGVLRSGNLGELYGAIRQAERPAAELTHPASAEAAETERITERVETVLEQILERSPRQERRVETHTPPPAVKIIHKTAPEEIEEETRTEQQRTRTTVQTDSRHEEVRRHEERQLDVTRQERTLVSETTEDVTALVNRALASQMKTISDQVYRQMEKRLQMERSRRGRM